MPTSTDRTADHGSPGSIAPLVAEFTALLGPYGVITDRQQLCTYECDGLAHYRVVPAVVVLPQTAQQVAGVVRACAAAGVPFVARGSGTGLSGGALARNVLDTGAQLLVTANPGCLMQIAACAQRLGGDIALAHTVTVLDASIRGLPVSALVPHSPQRPGSS